MTPTKADEVSTAKNVLTKADHFTSRLYKIGVNLMRQEIVMRREQFEWQLKSDWGALVGKTTTTIKAEPFSRTFGRAQS